jgi:DNA (cytosine-5)-methyltransferase 1
MGREKGGGEMKFIDMFCGMGTVRMGFEKAGHECVYSIEWDKHKRKIYEVIFGNEPESSDITTVRASDLPISDCWAFGAPCQDFSIAGTRTGLEGDRSSLVKEVFRLVRETQEEYRPEWLLYENVKGMLSSNKGFDYLEILFEMASLGYDIEFQLLNSKYFGVPQNRERVFTIGHLRARGSRKVFPISGQSNENTTVGKSTKTAVARTLTGGGHSGGNHSGMTILEVKQIGNVMPTANRSNPNQGRVYDANGIAPCLNKMEGGGREPMIVASGIYTCQSKDFTGPALQGLNRTVKANKPDAGVVLQETRAGHTSYRIRRLTPRECMRLQGVADEVTDKLIAAKISDSQMYRAAGDACTVNVIYEIAKRMAIAEIEATP